MSRLGLTVFVACLLALAPPARAASLEARMALLVRERPSSSARVVVRVPAGRRLPLLGRNGDGTWAHVRFGSHEGWVPSPSLRSPGDDSAPAPRAAAPRAPKAVVAERRAPPAERSSDDEPVRPLAKRRGVRPEAWVSKSRYHDGEDNKLIISVAKAEIYGRPANSGAIIGILKRGEQVQLVKTSADRKWINVDIGGGETAWIEARAVKPGRVGAPVGNEAPADDAAPTSVAGPARVARVEAPPPEPEPAPPPRAVRRSRGDDAPATVATVTAAPAASDNDAETPPRAKTARRGKATRIARRDDDAPPAAAESAGRGADTDRSVSSAAGSAAGDDSRPALVRDAWTAPGRVYFTPAVRGGVAILQQRFTSNGSGPLTNYQGSVEAVAFQVGLGLWGTVGKYLLLGGDASYAFAGGAQFHYDAGAGNLRQWQIQNHIIDAGVSVGVHFAVLGGLSLRARVGGEMLLDLYQQVAAAPLPSSRVLGMTVGLGLGAPALFTIGGRPFGASVYGGGLVPADRAQSRGLEEGRTSSTFGAFVGGGLSFGLLAPAPTRYRGQLTLEANYGYELVATHFTGTANRNNTIAVADRGSATHLISLGLGYYY